ncbi:hypothetical protein PR048_016283 [Dryococelus australis]|uniref:Uncharacterized protein n=1 Tax=Dryococelus australis TaxID=614101 RepID=A0ABQ9HJB3_9NEOP|nr:hypothetical protein PR048_016283 [Dryococelus australis]
MNKDSEKAAVRARDIGRERGGGGGGFIDRTQAARSGYLRGPRVCVGCAAGLRRPCSPAPLVGRAHAQSTQEYRGEITALTPARTPLASQRLVAYLHARSSAGIGYSRYTLTDVRPVQLVTMERKGVVRPVQLVTMERKGTRANFAGDLVDFRFHFVAKPPFSAVGFIALNRWKIVASLCDHPFQEWAGAAVVARLTCSPPTKAGRVQFPAGSLTDFRMWESCRRVFSGFSLSPRSFIPALLHTHVNHPHRLSRPRSISKEDGEEVSNRGAKLPYNGYSDEFLDRLEPNGNIPNDKDLRYGLGFVEAIQKFHGVRSGAMETGVQFICAEQQYDEPACHPFRNKIGYYASEFSILGSISEEEFTNSSIHPYSLPVHQPVTTLLSARSKSQAGLGLFSEDCQKTVLDDLNPEPHFEGNALAMLSMDIHYERFKCNKGEEMSYIHAPMDRYTCNALPMGHVTCHGIGMKMLYVPECGGLPDLSPEPAVQVAIEEEVERNGMGPAERDGLGNGP